MMMLMPSDCRLCCEYYWGNFYMQYLLPFWVWVAEDHVDVKNLEMLGHKTKKPSSSCSLCSTRDSVSFSLSKAPTLAISSTSDWTSPENFIRMRAFPNWINPIYLSIHSGAPLNSFSPQPSHLKQFSYYCFPKFFWQNCFFQKWMPG